MAVAVIMAVVIVATAEVAVVTLARHDVWARA